MRRYLALIAAGGALCAAAVRAQEDPGAGFQEARRLMREALQAKVASERASLEARQKYEQALSCLLYTSDAADDLPCVDLGGRRLLKKKKHIYPL